jgi:hypothetical protein
MSSSESFDVSKVMSASRVIDAASREAKGAVCAKRQFRNRHAEHRQFRVLHWCSLDSLLLAQSFGRAAVLDRVFVLLLMDFSRGPAQLIMSYLVGDADAKEISKTEQMVTRFFL